MKSRLQFVFAAATLSFIGHTSAEESPIALAIKVKVPGPEVRNIDFTYSFTVQKIPPETRRLHVWIPHPVGSDVQKLNSFKIRSSAGAVNYTIYREYENKNEFMYFDLSRYAKMGMKEVTVDVSYNITRRATHDSWNAESGARLDSLARRRYLSARKLIPVSGKIADEAWNIVGTEIDPYEKARLIYDNVVESVSYDKSGQGWGRGDAVHACAVRKGNCTDFHSLFIGETRAVKVPSRFIIGFSIPEQDSGKIGGYHCWSEFFIDGRGWLPVDASEAHKHQQKKEAFFTGLDANRIQFTIGRDIRIPKARTKSVNYSIYPHIEVHGRHHEEFSTAFSFEDVTRKKID